MGAIQLHLQYDVSAIRVRLFLRDQHIFSFNPICVALEISKHGNSFVHRLGFGRQRDLLHQYNRLVEQYRKRLANLV